MDSWHDGLDLEVYWDSVSLFVLVVRLLWGWAVDGWESCCSVSCTKSAQLSLLPKSLSRFAAPQIFNCLLQSIEIYPYGICLLYHSFNPHSSYNGLILQTTSLPSSARGDDCHTFDLIPQFLYVPLKINFYACNKDNRLEA